MVGRQEMIVGRERARRFRPRGSANAAIQPCSRASRWVRSRVGGRSTAARALDRRPLPASTRAPPQDVRHASRRAVRSEGGFDVNDDHLERRLTRSCRSAARGRRRRRARARRSPGTAAPGDGAAVEAAARAFVASLSPTGRDRATFPFTSAERTRWHWTVPASVPRNGLPLGAMSAGQRRLALALLRASTSPSRLPQGARHHVAAGRAAAHGHGRRAIRSTPTSTTSRSSALRALERGAGGSKGTISRGTSRSSGTRVVAEPFFLGAWPTRAGSAYRSVGRATGRWRARRTRRGRSSSRSTAGSAGRSYSRRSR